jgi:hypothetical protein
MPSETITAKGEAIPESIREKAGVGPDTLLHWSVLPNGQIVASKIVPAPPSPEQVEKMRRHIRARSGTWDGDISGEELLRWLRP